MTTTPPAPEVDPQEPDPAGNPAWGEPLPDPNEPEPETSPERDDA